MALLIVVWLIGYYMGSDEHKARHQREIKNKDAVIHHWERCCALQLEEIKAS